MNGWKILGKLLSIAVGIAIGYMFGYALFYLLESFFGDLWSVEAGGPEFIVYSPYYIMCFVGLIAGVFDNGLKAFLYCLFVGFIYLALGVILMLVMALFTPEGAVAAFAIAGLIGGGTVSVMIIFKR